ncbi:hypothetical protein SAMN05444397_11262 [Flavobacterium aquidurense]|uniref:Uncharacterized protein n=1 Tax=Flavobacterium frigidimaris TaxID=262320 RepID=A0ABX4BL61_FLAFR|nr:hypothetical protein [Flavobacterium frigidimaris]OXA75915.1 hypothetical protein B0A65_20395 [Flavobacterium frigidimaris]SDZ63980.1 hypothetical protein SAMN05444397_11262 [Flavobacterium aquidurense]
MKNLLITAALFFTVGIVSAQETPKTNKKAKTSTDTILKSTHTTKSSTYKTDSVKTKNTSTKMKKSSTRPKTAIDTIKP